ncbi:DUF202 domain-containing protein [Streptomyces sp. NPDC088554]|uniref:DUF202 domain-containing protein n=1 Tax=Streptomyces sp. NPDC088554 TaxID=3365865 RepID=UPI003821CD2C
MTYGEDSAKDPGLQPERTRLAWRRTTLTCTVVTILAFRSMLRGDATPAGLTAAALGVLLWPAFLSVAHRRALALRTPRPPRLPTTMAAAMAVCTVSLAVCAIAVTVTR